MKVFWGILVIVLLSGGVMAVSPFAQQTNFDRGFNVKVPEKEVFRVGDDYKFEFHLFNRTNGMPITNASCYFHLYNSTGSHQFTGYDDTPDNNFDYDFTVSGSNFTKIGNYYYNVQCNHSQTMLGGYAGEYIYVTAQGVPYSTTHGLTYVSMFGLLIGLFGFLVFFMLNVDASNYRNDEGKIIAINWKKYLKIFLFSMAYVTFVAIAYFAWNISYGILEFTEMENFFKFVFRTSFILIWPLFIVVIIWSIAQYVKDRKVEEFIRRNINFK